MVSLIHCHIPTPKAVCDMNCLRLTGLDKSLKYKSKNTTICIKMIPEKDNAGNKGYLKKKLYHQNLQKNSGTECIKNMKDSGT